MDYIIVQFFLPSHLNNNTQFNLISVLLYISSPPFIVQIVFQTISHPGFYVI